MKTKAEKRKEAQSRQAAHDELTPREKLAKLDRKLGKGKGAVKERAKLNERVAEIGKRRKAGRSNNF